MSIHCGRCDPKRRRRDTPTPTPTTQSSALYLRSSSSAAVRSLSIVETLGRPIDSVLGLGGIKEDLPASQSKLTQLEAGEM